MQCVYKYVACRSFHKVSSLQWEAVSVGVKATVVIYYNVNDDWGMESEWRAKKVNLWSWVILKIAVVMCHAKQVTLFLCVFLIFFVFMMISKWDWGMRIAVLRFTAEKSVKHIKCFKKQKTHF